MPMAAIPRVSVRRWHPTSNSRPQNAKGRPPKGAGPMELVLLDLAACEAQHLGLRIGVCRALNLGAEEAR